MSLGKRFWMACSWVAMVWRDNSDTLISILIYVIFGAFAIGIIIGMDSCSDSMCDSSCAEQYGDEWTGRQGIYESCDCIGPEGNIKAPR